MSRRNSLSEKARAELYAAFGGRCAYCLDAEATHLDHVVPRTAGGPNGGRNLVPACTPCGTSKANLSVRDWVLSLAAGTRTSNRRPGYDFWAASGRPVPAG